MNKENVLFSNEVYGETSIREYIRKEVFPYLPFWTWQDMIDSCDIRFRDYGVVHDVGFFVEIVQHNQDRAGTGWQNIEQDYQAIMSWTMDRWVRADDSYRF